MGDSKQSIKYRAMVEGSICASYIHQETTYFSFHYFKSYMFSSRSSRMKWELTPTNHRYPSSTNQLILLTSHWFIEWNLVHVHVLINCKEVKPYVA